MQNQKTQKSLVAKVLILFVTVVLIFASVQVFATAVDLSKLAGIINNKKLTFKSDEEAKQLDAVVKALKNAQAPTNYTDILIDENVDVSLDTTDSNAKKVKIAAKTDKSTIVTNLAVLDYIIDTNRVVTVPTSWYKSWWFLTLVVVTVVSVAGGVLTQ